MPLHNPPPRLSQMADIDADIAAALAVELAASRQQTARLLAASADGFWSWDGARNVMTDHHRCASLLGAKLPTSGNAMIATVFTAENANLFNTLVEDFWPTDAATFTRYLQLRCADQTLRWFQLHGVRETTDTAEKPRITGTLRDVHDLKMAEKTQATVFQISESAHTCNELEDLYRQIHHTIAELLPAKNLFIALYDRGTDVLSFPYYIDEYDLQPAPRPLGETGLTQRVIRTGSSVLMTPELRDIRIKNGEKIIGSVCLDWLGVPLISGAVVIGALVIQSYSGDERYTEKDQTLLHFVSNQVAAAIVRKQALDRITHMALHDSLTGLPNRALWHDRLRQAVQEAGRSQTQFALLCLDLNHFKPVNDNHGHAAGDALLVQVAQRLQTCVRLSDTLARLGGDEFTVLLRNIKTRSDVLLVVKQIEQTIAMPFIIGAFTVQISIAVGIAIYPEAGATADVLMRCGDEALYVQKAQQKAL